MAEEFGLEISASIVHPLDMGGGYAKTHENVGQTMQYKEGEIQADGSYQIDMEYQVQWMNNKGPVRPELTEVKVFAFNEERIGDTPYYYVDENQIEDISSTARYRPDPDSVHGGDYKRGDIRIWGKAANGDRNRCLVVLVYKLPELDYFADDVPDYMKSVVDRHFEKGISYAGFNCDETHIQFDWERETHFGETEIHTKYLTKSLADTYAGAYGEQYKDFPKYLVYFAYQQHGFLPGEEGRLPSQHVFGKSREDIVRTWKFRKRYYEMLQRRVVDLCKEAKEYAEGVFGREIRTCGHSSWEESPTCDVFFSEQDLLAAEGRELSLYEYTPAYVWSSSIRENTSACYDGFKWNEYLSMVGSDIPELGFMDRNYYGAAYTAGLALLNQHPQAYYACWGSPDQMVARVCDVAVTYGLWAEINIASEAYYGHGFIQGFTSRISDVLTLCPLDLNYVEDRFGTWMVQYGYTDYITEEKLLEFAQMPSGHGLKVRNRTYRALVVFYSPLISADTLELIKAFVKQGGTVIWCSAPALQEEGNILALWKEIFGIRELDFAYSGLKAKDETVRFVGMKDVKDMRILTDFLPDFIYPVHTNDARVICEIGNQTLGTIKEYAGGGKAVYLGFRPRDDQSCSLGEDTDTLFSVLRELGCYEENGCEASSRPADSPYIYNHFPNGTVTMTNHIRRLRDRMWEPTFFRDQKKDEAFMKTAAVTPREIGLDKMPILGHCITYEGTGILSYRYDTAAGLYGFGGNETTGIQIDEKEYRFTETPVKLVWSKIDGELLDSHIRQAYVLRCNTETRVKMPFDAAGMQCALCQDEALEPMEAYPFRVEGGETIIEIDSAARGKWVVFYETA